MPCGIVPCLPICSSACAYCRHVFRVSRALYAVPFHTTMCLSSSIQRMLLAFTLWSSTIFTASWSLLGVWCGLSIVSRALASTSMAWNGEIMLPTFVHAWLVLLLRLTGVSIPCRRHASAGCHHLIVPLSSLSQCVRSPLSSSRFIGSLCCLPYVAMNVGITWSFPYALHSMGSWSVAFLLLGGSSLLCLWISMTSWLSCSSLWIWSGHLITASSVCGVCLSSGSICHPLGCQFPSMRVAMAIHLGLCAAPTWAAFTILALSILYPAHFSMAITFGKCGCVANPGTCSIPMISGLSIFAFMMQAAKAFPLSFSSPVP